MAETEELPQGIPGFTIQKLLGKGGLGCVYLARQHTLDRPVAIKVLRSDRDQDPGVVRRFLREARVMARMDHPNLVRLFEFIEEDVGPAISMEYFPCGTLRTELERLAGEKSVLGEKRTLQLAIELVSALEALHQAGVVHRDLKPTNIFLRDSKEAVLGDLGASSRASDEETEITSVGVLVGTASYMAPELWRGEPATPMADLFALGITMHECLTGVHPSGQRVTGPEFRFTWSKQHIKEVSRPTRELVDKLLSPDPSKRAVDVDYLLKILPDTGVSLNLEKLAQSLGRANLAPTRGKSARTPGEGPDPRKRSEMIRNPTSESSSRMILILSVLISSVLSFAIGLKLRTGTADPGVTVSPPPSASAAAPSPVAAGSPSSGEEVDPAIALRERHLSRFRGVLSNIAPEVKGRKLGQVEGRFSDRLWLGWEQVDGGAPTGTVTLLFTCFDPGKEELRLVFPDWTPGGPCTVMLNGEALELKVSRNRPTQVELLPTSVRFGINRLLLVPGNGVTIPDGVAGVLNRRGALPLPSSKVPEDENPAVLAKLGSLHERMRKGVWTGMKEEALAVQKSNPTSVRLSAFLHYIDMSYVVTCRDMDRMGLQGLNGTSGMLVMTDLLPDMETALKSAVGSLVSLHGNLSRNPHRGIAWSTLGLSLGTAGGEVELGWRAAMYGCLLDPDDVSAWLTFGDLYGAEYSTNPLVSARMSEVLDSARIAQYLARRLHLGTLVADIDKILLKYAPGAVRSSRR